MKKSKTKNSERRNLVLRRETIAVLAPPLLSRVVGGNMTKVDGSTMETCGSGQSGNGV
jgi:hypothetical protein